MASLYTDKLKGLPGRVVEDADALIRLLRSPRLGQGGKHLHARQALRATWFDHLDGAACQRLHAVVLEELSRCTPTRP